MHAERIALVPLTDGSGAATVRSESPITGRILQVRYVPDGAAALATGADIVLSGDESGKAILTKADIGTVAAEWAPRQPTHAVADGAPALYAATGTAVNDEIVLAGEKLKLVVAQGGAAKTGTFYVWIG